MDIETLNEYGKKVYHCYQYQLKENDSYDELTDRDISSVAYLVQLLKEMQEEYNSADIKDLATDYYTDLHQQIVKYDVEINDWHKQLSIQSLDEFTESASAI
ncbi:hypothetical protein [Fodinibius salsisoli]|uniref:Uncharacterized protein n=1 Tax=Fodinibius salsisoli TaxID=2820877 RepID=A0ABT3PP94_9BACT|nr:hypothetical protein [Fodinibius salsisoli]MCW9707671.1 hypothetical protein [Fodinibius salsisoli]